MYDDNLPAGALNDPRAPWNQSDEKRCEFCGSDQVKERRFSYKCECGYVELY